MNGISYPMLAIGCRGVDMTRALNRCLSAGGLSVTDEEAMSIANSRAELLSGVERVEFGVPAIVVIAEAVATSPCLSLDCLADDLIQLQSAFYSIRDELPVEVPDVEIVDALRGCFDTCGGVDLIASSDTEEIMSYSEDYMRAVDAGADEEYRIADDKGRVYVFNEDEWAYDERATGWDGERWDDDWKD